MKMMMRLIPIVLIGLIMWGCGGEDLTSSGKVSTTTGWSYNDPENGGFEVKTAVEQETGPGLVLIEGGTFTMGRTQDDVLYEWDNVPRRVTVSSFYMDMTEIRNVDYREYINWLVRVFGMNTDTADVPGILQSQLHPGFAGVHGLPYPITIGDISSYRFFSSTDIDHIVVPFTHGNSSN